MRNNLGRSILRQHIRRIHPTMNEQQQAAYGNESPYVAEHWNVPVSNSEKLMCSWYLACGRGRMEEHAKDCCLKCNSIHFRVFCLLRMRSVSNRDLQL
jgi:hypothetical protein